MHVLLSGLSRFFQPTGICRFSANLANALAANVRIERVTLLLGGWQAGYFRSCFNLSHPKLEIVETLDRARNTSLERNRWFALELPRLAHSLRPDVVHLSFPVPVYRSLFRAPVVTTVHDLYPFTYPETFGTLNAAFKRLFFRRCLQASDAITCVSATTLDTFLDHFPRYARTHPAPVIHNTATFEAIEPRTPTHLALEDGPFLLAVGQHQLNKRYDLMLRGVALARREGKLAPEIPLVIVGSDGSETERLKAQAEQLGLGGRILWSPPLDDAELAWLYRNCELFLATSWVEGFCLPLVEALSCAARVICSDIPTFREIGLDRCTLFSRNGDAARNFAEAIPLALRRPKPPPFVDPRFDPARNSDEYLRLYRGLVR